MDKIVCLYKCDQENEGEKKKITFHRERIACRNPSVFTRKERRPI